ncbi:hypothetical protein Ancab_030596 [Ancistrocladus abbreviatus]
MEGIIRGGEGGGGAGGGVAVIDNDLGDGMQCSDHPYRNNAPGGICAFCLQEKLGKLVSSSSSSFFIGSSSSSPSFRSDTAGATVGFGVNSGGGTTTVTTDSSTASHSLSLSLRPTTSNHENDGYCSSSHRRARIPFLLTQKKKKVMAASDHHHQPSNITLKRSKSTATPRRNGGGHYLVSDGQFFSPQKKGFWSFLYLSSKHGTTTAKETERPSSIAAIASSTAVAEEGTAALQPQQSISTSRPNVSAGAVGALSRRADYVVMVDETDSSPNSSGSNAASFGRKVSRSRSVGCGSRSFSGDFLERISTGFGDCTLRRVESQREGKRVVVRGGGGGGDGIKERVRCGGIFSGFMMTSSSSSSSSSSYWVSSSAEDHVNGKGPGAGMAAPAAGHRAHGMSRSWGWAFASPMRAFSSSSKPSCSSSSSKQGKSNKNNENPTTTPNLAAIPSLLAVRS